MEKKKSILQTLKTLFLILTVSLSMAPLSAQDSRITNPKFAKLLQKMLSHSVPELSCVDFNNKQDEFIILDTREQDEYYVSHIKTLGLWSSKFEPIRFYFSWKKNNLLLQYWI